MMHFPSDTRYALGALAGIFFAAAREVEGDEAAVHFSFPKVVGNRAEGLPDGFANLLEYDLQRPGTTDTRRLSEFLGRHRVERALAFDLAPGNPTHRTLRSNGVGRVVSYLGAPMGTPVRGLRRLTRQIRTRIQAQADHYVFESSAMQETGVLGRGLDPGKTSVVVTGLALERFRCEVGGSEAAFRELGIPSDRKVIFYSGHMEPRKGVAVIMQAAVEVIDRMGQASAHFLLCGNRSGEAEPYLAMLRGTRAAQHVTFAGYRDDLPVLMAGSRIGVIASTGWDSFPRTAMEMSAAGLPLVASALQGLNEAVVPGETGFLFRPGDPVGLATILADLLRDEGLCERLGHASRRMAVERYSEERQIAELAEILARQG